jgi:hypothetical protein
MFGIVFEEFKSYFSIQKGRFFFKKNAFQGSKSQKWPKSTSDKNLKMKLFPKNFF